MRKPRILFGYFAVLGTSIRTRAAVIYTAIRYRFFFLADSQTKKRLIRVDETRCFRFRPYFRTGIQHTNLARIHTVKGYYTYRTNTCSWKTPLQISHSRRRMSHLCDPQPLRGRGAVIMTTITKYDDQGDDHGSCRQSCRVAFDGVRAPRKFVLTCKSPGFGVHDVVHIVTRIFWDFFSQAPKVIGPVFFWKL